MRNKYSIWGVFGLLAVWLLLFFTRFAGFDLLFPNGKDKDYNRTLERDYAASDGCIYEVSVRGDLPSGCELAVSEVEETPYLPSLRTAIDENAITYMKFLDISLVKDGTEMEPESEVEVGIRILDRQEKPGEYGRIFHFQEKKTVQLHQEAPPLDSETGTRSNSDSLSRGMNRVSTSMAETGSQGNQEEDDFIIEAVEMASFEGNEVSFKTSSFSIYGIVYASHLTYISASGEAYSITVSYDQDAGIPEGAELTVREIAGGSAEHEAYLAAASETVYGRVVDAGFLDLEIWYEGEKVEPTGPVKVEIQRLGDLPEGSVRVVHFTESLPAEEEGTLSEPMPPVPDSLVLTEEDDYTEEEMLTEESVELLPADTVEGNKVTFTTDSFSVYGIIYTVDFSYLVNGKEYDFSLPGGGFISFSSLIEVLGVVDEPNSADGEAVSESKSDSAAPLFIGGLGVSDAARAFVTDVESIKFSNPRLVDVSRAEYETTVGEIKESRGLDIRYSAELTKEQIEEINAQRVAAGDWVLISVEPFTSEELLTVTMKNGNSWTVKVTDAQIFTNVLTADGERFRITVTYEDDANIPDGSILAAKEIPEGSQEYDQYLAEAAEKWAEAEREGVISFARFFDLEIQKDGEKIEPEAPVEVDIVHEEGFTTLTDEELSVIHFAEDGTEIIDDLFRNEKGTQIVYEQSSFSVIGTVSTVKESGWPTSNGQYVLVLQDGDDYYALKQDGTLTKVRYFNNTVSFIGEGTTTTDYIKDYLWYVQSYTGATAKGRISDKYYESGVAEGQKFISPTSDGWLVDSARQINFDPTKQMLYYTMYSVSRTLSAHNGQLSVVDVNNATASKMYFVGASSFTANANETDLFTQEEVESLINIWKEQKIQEASSDKTAEVYDYENRVYQVDITASSADHEVSPSIALEFVVDASRSMFFPTSLTQVGTFSGTNGSNVWNWIDSHGDTDQVYFVIQDKDGKATQYVIFYDPNSEYTVNEGYYVGRRWVDKYVTYRGQWLWCDASNYNPPDDTANGGSKSSRYAGYPVSTWSYGSMDDGKIYTTEITGTSTGTYGERKTWVSRIEYLKQCVRVASQVVYAVDENAQIGLIGFNSSITDYGTFGKTEQASLLDSIDNISLAGGTDQQGGLQKAYDKYKKNTTYYAQHYAGRKHVVVLVTDGAPNATNVSWSTIGTVATNLKNLKDDFGNKTELYTMGLSLSNVGSNQTSLFGVSSGDGYKYAAEDAAQIIDAVTKMVDGIFVQANLIADVTDVIDLAFYPVDASTGRPLSVGDKINLNGRLASASDAAGEIKKDPATGNWYVEWKNQRIDWPTTDASGAVTAPGWHGTVFVKAKEDFLGGNGISTNAAGSQLEAKKYMVRGSNDEIAMPAGDHITSFETPYVNVDELDITRNSTEWTVYLGENVDPLKELKKLWETVKVKEVVTKMNSDHLLASDENMTYEFKADTSDNRPVTHGREEFPITDIESIVLTDADWTNLIAGQSKIVDYNAYGHSKVGTIMISLSQYVGSGEKNLTESPHDTTAVGNSVEKYTLTVSYRPSGANISNWHTGSYGSSMSGNRAGTIFGENTHIINVFAKGIQITKVDVDDHVLTGAKFALYRTARDGETDLLTIEENDYYKVAELDTSTNGIATKEQIEKLPENEKYYLVETQAPAGYVAIPPIPVILYITDEYIPMPGTQTQTVRPEDGIFNWNQKVILILDAASGVKRTNADNTKIMTYSGTSDSVNEILYYRIINNPGIELPSTGGPGTDSIYRLGVTLTVFALLMLLRTRIKL